MHGGLTYCARLLGRKQLSFAKEVIAWRHSGIGEVSLEEQYVRADNNPRESREREVKETKFGFRSQECENKPRGPARLGMTNK